MGPVHLTVSDLPRSLDYYTGTIGLEVLEAGAGRASLGSDGRELLVLVEEPGAPSARGYTGLFHVALLVPARPALARWLAHAARDQVRLEGLSDHTVSEAIYLRDPDDHGIEIYADRPRAQWDGRVGQMIGTAPLDVESLLGELDDPETEPFDSLAPGTVMGHVHLTVSDIPSTVDFYRDVVGLGVTAQLGSAAFMSAGGYHHHVGANIWETSGRPHAPAGTAALRHATIVLPDRDERDLLVGRLEAAGHAVEDGDEPAFVDPSGNRLVLAV